MARLKGTSGNSKGERFFDLLSGRPWVRIPPGVQKIHQVLYDLVDFIFFVFRSSNRFKGD